VRVIIPLALAFFAILLPVAPAAATNLAVFNFQLKTGQEDWVWLEKFMSDQMATDLVQDRSLSVVARDRMQLMAQQMKWVPELATTDAKVMGGIRSQLQIEYLVTGVCSVAGDQLEITAQIVEVQTRKEVHRKTVTGKTDQVIDLQKQLSADAMSWFTKRPAREILKTLPMWTRSIPAVRALYEGMHLYDQGRYAEGWLKFRQSSQEDRNYVEAVYWVGKMYYFMYRYDHARRTLEKFVYLDCLHPRMGDALQEYVDSYESSGNPDELLVLYRAFGQRFPRAIIREQYWDNQHDLLGAKWADLKQEKLLKQLGRYRESAIVGDNLATWARHHALTCEPPPDDRLFHLEYEQVLRFSQARPSMDLLRYQNQTDKIIGEKTERQDWESRFYQSRTGCPDCYLYAPSGCVFKQLRFDPIADGDDATLELSLRPAGLDARFRQTKAVPLKEARAKGLTLKPPRPWGMWEVDCTFTSNSSKAGIVAVRGVRITAEIEALKNCGAAELSCENNDRVDVDVDGAFAGPATDIIGPLPAGEHTITARPRDPNTPYGQWRSTVSIEPNQVTKVRCRLPWRDATTSASLNQVRVATEYDAYDLFTGSAVSEPAIQADDQAIRVVWSRGGDLWFSVSTDGNSYSAPKKLPLPVSTVWAEYSPRVLRDESGRFVLTFVSDRDEQHLKRVYFTWSRDFVHWAAPSLISQYVPRYHDLIQDARGRYICLFSDLWFIRVLCSDDGYIWTKLINLAKMPPARAVAQAKLLVDRDGGIQLHLLTILNASPEIVSSFSGYSKILRYVTRDGKSWSPTEAIAGYPYKASPPSMCLARAQDGVAVLATKGGLTSEAVAQLSIETEHGWEHTGQALGVLVAPSALTYHPRWGYVVANGPYVTRCKDLPAVLSRQAALNSDSVLAKVEPDPPPPARENEATKKAPPPLPIGQARYEPCRGVVWWQKNLVFRGSSLPRNRDDFSNAKACLGIVHPHALAVRTEHEGLALSIALDANDPNSKSYKLMKLDFTGRNDFRHPTVVPLTCIQTDYASKQISSDFDNMDANCIVGDRRVRARVGATYDISGDELSLSVFLGTCAKGLCQFGNRSFMVCVYDTNSNLRVGDKGRHGVVESHDWVVVDAGNGLVESYYGCPVSIDGKLYVVTFSPDTMKLSAEKYTGQSGLLQIDHGAWEVWLQGSDSVFRIRGGSNPVPIPVGHYTLSSYTEFADPERREGSYRLLCTDDLAQIDVRDGNTVNCKLGSPVVCSLTATVTGRSVTFKYSYTDVAGWDAAITEPGSRFRVDPSIRVLDAGNRPVDKAVMKWSGAEQAWVLDWQVRAGLTGKFTAVAECDAGPLTPKPVTATFTLK
jgi:TolB-like protein